MRYPRITIKKNQSGMASIVIVVIMMIVISMVVVGFAKIVRREQMATLDRHLSSRAFYAAESGVNLITQNIDRFPSGKPDCITDPGNVLNANDYIIDDASATKITCLTVSDNPTTIDYPTVIAGRALVVPLNTTASLTSVTFSWNNTDTGPKNYGLCNSPAGLDAFPQATSAAWDCPSPLLRIDLVRTGSGVTRQTLLDSQYTVFVRPRPGPGTPSVATYSSALPKGTIVNANCMANNVVMPRDCNITINGLSGSNYYARIISMYQDANLEISGRSGAAPVGFLGVQAIIDSTARAQDVVRRIQVRKSLIDNADQISPTYAVQGAAGICKRYAIVPGSSTVDVDPAPGSDLCPAIAGSVPPAPPAACSPHPNDVVFALDSSDTMGQNWQTGTRIAKLKQVTNAFVNNTNVGAVNHEGFISFSDVVLRSLQLSNTTPPMTSFINGMSLDYGTRYLPALNAAQTMLTGSSSRSGATKILIFASDGIANDYPGDSARTSREILARTNAMKSRGIVIFTIGINTSSSALRILSSMAGNGGYFANAASEAQLTSIMNSIANGLNCH